jgi:uncharacterized membrane protein
MPVISEVESRKRKEKPLGVYLVEAGLITSAQVNMALDDQKVDGGRLGEILVDRGWVEQQTIEYLMEKVVLPERRAVEKKLSHPEKNASQNLTIVGQASQVERQDSDLLLLPVPSRELEVHLSPRRTVRFLFLVVLGLALASLFTKFTVYFLPDYPLRDFFARRFNVDAEQTIPALYSASALLFCSILLAVIAYAKKVAGERYVRPWGALSIIFLYLSLDEAAMIHERMIGPLRSALNTSGFLYFPWVIPGAIFVLICLLAFLPFLTHLPAKTRRLFLIAGTIFVGGAICIEIFGAPYWELYGNEPKNMTYAMIATVEEFLEMLGIVVFIYALLSYMSSYMKGVSLRVKIINDRTDGVTKKVRMQT